MSDISLETSTKRSIPSDMEKNEFSKGIDQYHVDFSTRCWQELKSPKLYVMLISFIGGMLLASGHLLTGVTFSFLPILLVRHLYEKERQKKIDNHVKEIERDPKLMNVFLTLMNAPQATHTMNDLYEKADWINDILKRIWPYCNGTVQNEIDRKGYTEKSEHSKGMDIGGGHIVYFDRFTLGDKPPVITHIGLNKAATRTEEELVVELKVLYFGNCLLSFSKKTLGCFTIKGGVKDVYFRGNARLVFRPLLKESPYFGGMSFCLLDRPIIDYDGINLANLADNKMFKNFLISVVESIIVAPNKLHFPFKDDAEVKRKLKFTVPLALCYFQIIEAENLPRMDAGKIFAITSQADPFCVIKVGSMQFRTPIVFNSCNPYWGESHSAPIHDYFDQFKVDIFDKDALSADDLIGSIEFQLKDIITDIESHGRDQWLPIGKCISGLLHFRVACFPLKKSLWNLPNVIERIGESKHKFPAGLFSVYIYQLRIPSKNEIKSVIPVIELKFGGKSIQTLPVNAEKPNVRTLQFNIEETYHFRCNDPGHDVLEVTVLDASGINLQKLTRLDALWDYIIGSCSVKVSHIIKEETLLDEKAAEKTAETGVLERREIGVHKTCDLIKGKDSRESRGSIKFFVCFQTIDVEKDDIYKNLQIPADIRCSINQATSETSFFRRVLMQPGESLRHPCKTLRNLKNTTIPFFSKKSIPVVDDMSPAPVSVKNDCHLKIRVKWPERTYLFFEVLRLIHIPVVYSDPKHHFSVIIKLGLTLEGRRRKLRFGRRSFTTKKTHKYFYPPTDAKKEARSVIINERLTFKIDPTLSLENYDLHISLMVHRRSNICCSESNKIATIREKIPALSFRSDPVEQWYRLAGSISQDNLLASKSDTQKLESTEAKKDKDKESQKKADEEQKLKTSSKEEKLMKEEKEKELRKAEREESAAKSAKETDSSRQKKKKKKNKS